MGLLDRLGLGRPDEAEVTARVRAALGPSADPPAGADPPTYLRLPQGGSLSGVLAVPDLTAYAVGLRTAVETLVDALGGGRAADPVVVYLTGRTPDGTVLTPADLDGPDGGGVGEKPIVRDLLPRLSNPR